MWTSGQRSPLGRSQKCQEQPLLSCKEEEEGHDGEQEGSQK